MVAMEERVAGSSAMKSISAFEKRGMLIVSAAENVEGVKEVHDHLCWAEPMSGLYLNSPEDEKSVKAS